MGDLVARGMAKQAKLVTDDVTLHNAQIGLRGWRLAKANQDAVLQGLGTPKIINLNCIGDSITEGVSDLSATVDNYRKAWVDIVRNAINTKYGDVGEGFIGNRYPVAVAEVNRRWIYTGTWVTESDIGWMVGNNAVASLFKGTSGTATIVFDNCGKNDVTGFVLIAKGTDSSPTVSVSVDGGEPETWLIPTGFSDISTFVKTGLSAGSHTVVVNVTAGLYRGFSFFGGYETTAITSGIRVNKLATSGARSDTLARDLGEEWGSNFYIKTCVDFWTPSLSIISLIANDYHTTVSLETYRSQIETIVSKAILTSSSVMLTSIGGVLEVVKTIPIKEYKQILYDVAMKYGIAYLDIAKRWGNTYQNASGFINDGTHPTQIGHQDIASAVLKVLEIS